MAADDWVSEDQLPPAGGGSWWDTAKNVGQTADDAVRAAANAVTFGMADRFAGYMNSGGPQTMKGLITGDKPLTYDEAVNAEVAKSGAARERSPYASVVGDVAGAAAVPMFGAEALAARLGGGIGARALGYGVTGAATGAAQGAGNTYTGDLPDYAKNALIGGALGGALGSAGGAIFGRGPTVSRAQVPTQEELWAAKNTGYNALGNSGARYEQQPLRDLANTTEQQLLAERYHWRDSPGTWRGIEEARVGGAPGQLNTGLGAPVSPADIDFIVKGLNKIPKTSERATDRDSARIYKRALNDFIENPPPGAVLPGTEREAAQASTLARNARGDNAGYRRVQAIDELINNATNTAGATHSGLGLQAELRKGVRSFVKEKEGISPATKQGFIQPEIDALTDYSRGTNVTNMLRYGSNALGGGGGIGAPIAAAAYGTGGGIAGQYFKDDPSTASAVGLMAPVLGTTLRMIGNRRANNEISAMRDLIAQRTPLYDYRASMSGTRPGAGSPNAAKGVRDALALELMKPRRVDIDTSDWQ